MASFHELLKGGLAMEGHETQVVALDFRLGQLKAVLELGEKEVRALFSYVLPTGLDGRGTGARGHGGGSAFRLPRCPVAMLGGAMHWLCSIDTTALRSTNHCTAAAHRLTTVRYVTPLLFPGQGS